MKSKERSMKQSSETNHLRISLISLLYFLAPMGISALLVGKYASFLNVVLLQLLLFWM